jgi:hypothetical protein
LKKNAFVSEVSFGNVAKVMSAIHVFENCEKCNSLFMSVFFCLLTFQAKMKLFVNKVGFEIFVEVMAFHMCLRMAKSAIVCLFFLLCLSLLF